MELGIQCNISVVMPPELAYPSSEFILPCRVKHFFRLVVLLATHTCIGRDNVASVGGGTKYESCWQTTAACVAAAVV